MLQCKWQCYVKYVYICTFLLKSSQFFNFQTLVLSKVTPRTLKNTPSPDKNISMPEVNPDPGSSNIYSVGERIILAWLNHHYEHYRQKIWLNCEKGESINNPFYT